MYLKPTFQAQKIGKSNSLNVFRKQETYGPTQDS
jgi:hypothetical protein